ncbi:von Willebrand factor A domain-containing protein 5A [Ctenodactylus gundi]
MAPLGGLLTRKDEPVALKNISVALSIREFVAGVSATLIYENEEQVPVSTFFMFPLDEDSAVYSFEALVDGRKIVAELYDKMEAHGVYEEVIMQGHKIFLLEEDMCSRDIFYCNVGNIQPRSRVALTLRYVQELPLEDDGALRYVLPVVLNPRYHPSERTEGGCLDVKSPVVPVKDVPYTLSVVTTIHSQHGIDRVQCSCPLDPIEFFGNNQTSAQVSLAGGHKFDRDVEFLIYHRAVHSPSVFVEMGLQQNEPESLMGDPAVMVSFYPDIPEAEVTMSCGEFVFIMDRSKSMQSPVNKQDRSQLRIEAAKEILILLLKNLPMGCFFNVYGFGSSYESFFLQSVKYTPQTMQEAVERVKLMSANLRGTDLLSPLRRIYKEFCISGHPRQIFVFTDGEISDAFRVINEVSFHSKEHRCFSFGIGEGISTSLIKSIARISGGTSEFITSKDRMQSKALRTLKRSLQYLIEDVSLSWKLPRGLSVDTLSPEHTSIFRDQRLIFYGQLIGTIPPREASAKVCLRYRLQGHRLEKEVTFSLQPKHDANFTVHRLAGMSLIQSKDLGFRETPARNRTDVVITSLETGIMSSFTAFVAMNKELNEPVHGPLVPRDIPRPMMFRAPYRKPKQFPSGIFLASSHGLRKPGEAAREKGKTRSSTNETDSESYHEGMVRGQELHNFLCFLLPSSVLFFILLKVFGENGIVQLVFLQKANGSWDLDEDLAKALGMTLEDIKAAHPTEHVDSSGWATVLAVVWLHVNGRDTQCEWNLLERQAVAWLRDRAVFGENHFRQLISLLNANGSWDLDEDLAKALGMTLEDIKAAHPTEHVDSSGWATILALVWLHANRKDFQCEWDLLEQKAVAWLRSRAASTMHIVVKAANTLLQSSVDPAVFDI